MRTFCILFRFISTKHCTPIVLPLPLFFLYTEHHQEWSCGIFHGSHLPLHDQSWRWSQEATFPSTSWQRDGSLCLRLLGCWDQNILCKFLWRAKCNRYFKTIVYVQWLIWKVVTANQWLLIHHKLNCVSESYMYTFSYCQWT